MSRRKPKMDAVMEGVYKEYFGYKDKTQLTWERMRERMYIRVLSELCMNRFHWYNLPKSLDHRFLEKKLFNSALAVFFRSAHYNEFFILGGSASGNMNFQDNPTRFTLFSNGMDNLPREIKADDCVPIWANYMRIPDWDIVFQYARSLSAIDRTIEIAVDNMRTPVVMWGPEETQLSMENAWQERTEGAPVIFATPEFGEQLTNNIGVMELAGHPDKLPKLLAARNQMWSQCMGILGVNNANTDKRERLVADEVSANDEQVGAMRNVVMNSRKIAANMINEKYGLNVRVEFNTDIERQAEEMKPVINEGGE